MLTSTSISDTSSTGTNTAANAATSLGLNGLLLYATPTTTPTTAAATAAHLLFSYRFALG